MKIHNGVAKVVHSLNYLGAVLIDRGNVVEKIATNKSKMKEPLNVPRQIFHLLEFFFESDYSAVS